MMNADLEFTQNLRIPGPTPLPAEVLLSMSKQMINHRGDEYAALQRQVVVSLKEFYGTESEILLITASGTGGLEAAVVNILSPGDRVLAVTIGVFGERFASIAEAYGADVERLSVPWGTAARPEQLREALERAGIVKAVLLTCNETSTGVMNDIQSLTAVINELPYRPLVVVDAISALGAVQLPMDALGLDVLVTGSQKAWMAPPGLTMIGFSRRAWDAHREARMPRYYFDFSRQQKAQLRGQDAWTPSVTTMYALATALKMMEQEGCEAIIDRHQAIASQTQRGLEALGFQLFAEQGFRSVTVTAAVPPHDVRSSELIRWLALERNVIVADGQDRLAGSMVRLGHLGWVTPSHIDHALDAISDALDAVRQSTGFVSA